MKSSESHQAHGDSDTEEDLKDNDTHSNGARSAKREEENRRRTSRKDVCRKPKPITRSRETEKYRDKDEENKAKIEGTPLMYEGETSSLKERIRTSLPESKVMSQDTTRKRKDVNCVEKKPGVEHGSREDDEAREAHVDSTGNRRDAAVAVHRQGC